MNPLPFSSRKYEIPNTVKKIESGAFEKHYRTTVIIIPSSVIEIESDAFFESEIREIKVVEGNERYTSIDGVLFNKNKTELIAFPSIRTGKYTIPEGVTNIGNYAFVSSRLTKITIPSTVTKIGDYVFDYYCRLENVEIYSRDIEISSNAFKNVQDKLTIHGYKGSKVEEYATQKGIKFIPIAELEYEQIGNNVTRGEVATTGELNEVKITGVEEGIILEGEYAIPSQVVMEGKVYKVTSIGAEAFKDCTGLTEITIPEEIAEIETEAFKGCNSLKSVTIKTNNEVGELTWGDNVFDGVSEDIIIKVRLGSTAEVYAVENKINYEIIDVAKIERDEVIDASTRGREDGNPEESKQTKVYGYLSLQEAIEDAEEKGDTTIELIKDIKLEAVEEGTEEIINMDIKNKKITGGKTIINEGNYNIINGEIEGQIINKGIVSLENIEIISETKAIENEENGTVNIKTGTILKGKEKAIENKGQIIPEEKYCLRIKEEGEYEKAELTNIYKLTIDTKGGTWNNLKENIIIKNEAEGILKEEAEINAPKEPKVYIVTFDSKGEEDIEEKIATHTFTGWTTEGEGTLEGTTYRFGEGDGKITANYTTSSIILPEAELEGSELEGWYTEEECINKVGNANEEYTPEGDIKLYAKWTKIIANIGIKEEPIKTVYKKGETFDKTGGKIIVVYEDGTTEEKEMESEEVEVEGYDENKIGEQLITVSYKGYNAVFKVKTVEEIIKSDKYEIKEESGVSYIENIKAGTTISELKEGIITEGTLEVYEGENIVDSDDVELKTGMKVKGNLNGRTEIFEIVVLGDITGDGKTDDLDLLMLARYKAEFEIEKEIVVGAKLRATDIVKNNQLAEDVDLLKLARVLAKLDNI